MGDVDKIFVFGDPKSQTDLAADAFNDISGKPRDYYPVDKAKELIRNIPERSLMLLPAWNLYFGLVDKADYMSALADESCQISSLDPKRIEFAVCKKDGCIGDKIVSVNVARKQCSKYLDEHGLVPLFNDASVTNEAESMFLESVDISTLLCAPELADEAIKKADEKGLVVKKESDNVSNPSNYTVFGSFMPYSEVVAESGAVNYWLIEMDVLPNELDGESRDRFWNDLIGDASVDSFRLCVFLSTKDDYFGGYRLLLETKYILESPLPHGVSTDLEQSEDGYSVKHVGKSSSMLSDRLHTMLDDIGMLGGDDVSSPGLLACPESGIFIHGYSKETIAKFAIDFAEMFRQKMGLLDEASRRNIMPFLDMASALS